MTRQRNAGRRGRAPPIRLVTKIAQLSRARSSEADNVGLTAACRELLRAYDSSVSRGESLTEQWPGLVRKALSFLGGQADRHTATLADYDSHRYGPFLGVSDGGGAARNVRRAAFASPKAQALGRRATPLTLGVGLDGERLASIGEVPVGPDEFAEIWTECAGRTLLTTNVGSRANLRLYRRPPTIVIAEGTRSVALDTAKKALAAEFKPFRESPDTPRPVVVFVEFREDFRRSLAEKRSLLRALRAFAADPAVASARIHRIGLLIRIGSGAAGRSAALRALDLASASGIRDVSIAGVVRHESDGAVSLPGLLTYLAPEYVAEILAHGQRQGIDVDAFNLVDADSVARATWASLNTARAMGLDLGKYGLFPLTLEESETVIGHMQHWFRDWCAAPVFYVDQGILSRTSVYAGSDTEAGIKAWFAVLARHRVQVCLIDTVDKSQGWKILKAGNDPKGILESKQIVRLTEHARKLGIRVLWAGGITREQAYELGKLGVFGIYVTSAAAVAGPVTGDYRNDPALAAEKVPTFEGVLAVKTLMEAGFLVERLGSRGSSRARKRQRSLRLRLQQAGLDTQQLATVLPAAWRSWWTEQR